MEKRYETVNRLSDSQAEALAAKLNYSLYGIKGCRLDENTREIVIQYDESASSKEIDETVERLLEQERKIRGIRRRVLKNNMMRHQAESRVHPELKSNERAFINGRVIRALDQLFEQMALKQNAIERSYSPLIRIDALHTCNYLHTFPHNIYLLSEFPHHLKTLEKVREATQREMIQYSQVTDYALAPAVCFHCYEELSGRKLDVPKDHRPLLMTASAPCSRHEAGWRVGGYRLRSFTMREIIMIGSSIQVEEYRSSMIEDVWQLFMELGLQGRIETASDPFYFSEDAPKGQHQLMADSKYELIVDTGQEQFSIASFNAVGDALCRSYRIHDENDQPHHSGCIAFGLERWSYALGRVHGTEPDEWPKRIIHLLQDKGAAVRL